ncbi:MAG TPA: putative toxin-antitoxin system toxin component, PIN family, partial [Promineifilum sp.]|nr:putative toxin-antitoxin system toxin component, PIN family [Promineifilum sp.]
LRTVAEEIPRIEQTIPAIARDAKDDYLLAYAVVEQADYLVTGDKDLLVLEEIARVKIVSTVAFADLLSATTP